VGSQRAEGDSVAGAVTYRGRIGRAADLIAFGVTDYAFTDAITTTFTEAIDLAAHARRDRVHAVTAAECPACDGWCDCHSFADDVPCAYCDAGA